MEAEGHALKPDRWLWGNHSVTQAAGALPERRLAGDTSRDRRRLPSAVDVLREAAAENTEAAEVLEVTIDGVPVQNVREYRAASPAPFSLTYPENSVVGVPAGEYYPQVADGYWLMLAPLSKGEHLIEIHVVAPGTIFGTIEFTTVHHLTVE